MSLLLDLPRASLTHALLVHVDQIFKPCLTILTISVLINLPGGFILVSIILLLILMLVNDQHEVALSLEHILQLLVMLLLLSVPLDHGPLVVIDYLDQGAVEHGHGDAHGQRVDQ